MFEEDRQAQLDVHEVADIELFCAHSTRYVSFDRCIEVEGSRVQAYKRNRYRSFAPQPQSIIITPLPQVR